MLSGVEKAASAFRLALEIKELATKLGFITTEIAANTTKETIKKSQTLISSATEITIAAATSAGVVAASTPGIMASFFRSMGPWGWAAAAVAIAAIGGSMSGGGSDPKAGFAAEEQQAIQGTGRSYNGNGDLVNNGGGALGDSGAKSKAIENSIALIQEHTFNLLSFSNGKTYDALVAIRDNTQIFAKALGGTTGITGGLSAFGTQEGSSKGFLGFNSSSTEVKDTGIIIAGAIKELIQGGGTKQQYENVQNSSSSFFGLFNSSSSSTNSKGLKSTVTASVTNIFSSFKDTLVSLAESVGSEAQTVSNLLDGFNINIKTSGKGLTGAEFASAITEEILLQNKHSLH